MTPDYRQDFPLLKNQNIVYIDNAATSQRPQCVLDAEMEFYVNHNANPMRGSYPLSVEATAVYDDTRVKVRDFIGAEHVSEIIFTRNTTESMNLVAYSYGLTNIHEGDEILVSIMEHHSNLLPWQMVAGRTGAILKYLECEPDGRIDLEKAAHMITDRTRLVALTQVSNVLGRVNPVREIADLAHEKGAVIVVDGAQSTTHMAIDVKALGADFFAFSGHKILGPMGIGVLYGRRELLKVMPPFMTGGEMIDSVTRDGAKWAPLPQKFEAGTVNAGGAAGLGAAIDYYGRVGYAYMRERERRLTALCMEGMRKIPHLHILGSDDPEDHTGIVTFKIDDVHPHDVSWILADDGICVRAGHHCAQPLLAYLGTPVTTRASFMFYNTEEEVERFLASLAKVRERMGYGEQKFLQ